jgi:transcriptional regulator with XRE-family HTH domain
MNITTTAGRVLREARLKRSISMTELAKIMGISIQMVCDVESGRKPLPDKYIDPWAESVGEDPDLIAIDIWQRRLNDFNRNRTTRRKISFRVVPVVDGVV